MKPDYIWCFNENHRVYRHDDGTVSSGPIWRKHWSKYEVVGETKVSWILIGGGKVPKKNHDPIRYAFTEAEIDRQEWVHDNIHHINRAMYSVRDFEVLQKIAALIGYDSDANRRRSA